MWTTSSAIVEKPRCRVGQFWPKVEDWNWETIFYGHYFRSTFDHSDIIGLQSYRIRWKKCKIRLLRRSRSFKVIEVGTNRKSVCDFLLVINSNWHPISYLFGAIAAYCSNFWHCVFEPPLGWLRANVRWSSKAHWKARSGLPISVTWTFFPRCYGRRATGENTVSQKNIPDVFSYNSWQHCRIFI